MRALKITATTTPTVCYTGSESEPQHILVSVPTGGQTVFFGGDGDTESIGFPVAAGSGAVPMVVDGDLLCSVAATTQVFEILAPGSN